MLSPVRYFALILALPSPMWMLEECLDHHASERNTYLSDPSSPELLWLQEVLYTGP